MIKDQHDVNWNDPEECFAWVFRNIPSMAGSGALSSPLFLRRWSKHLVEVGCVHVDYLHTLADENGNIHVSKLPKQTIKWVKPIRGPYHAWNNAGTWIPIDDPEPQKFKLPDMSQMTRQEQAVMVQQMINLGLVDTERVVKPSVAKEITGDNT